MKEFRIERDSMGEVEVPADALYGAQTQRAIDNFQLSSITMPFAFVRAVALVKYCAAEANGELGVLEADKVDAIKRAALEVFEGQWQKQFPIGVFQTGSGTSTNMNVNEVLAHLASRATDLEIHPNDDVNLGQSSNDVIPTAIQVSTARRISRKLLPALEHLHSTISNKARQLDDVVKTGRTHLMDAMPLTMGQELDAWAFQVEQASERLSLLLPQLHSLPQGGTAIGTGINCHPKFSEQFCKSLSDFTEMPFTSSANKFAGIAGQDVSVAVMGALASLASTLMKISNDLRWMNSGPLAGLGEIELKALQPGSSIMPGKVNPVVPEAVCMACAQVFGNQTTVSVAAQSSNFQLNVMLPVIAYNLLQSTQLLTQSAYALADQSIVDFKVNEQNISSALDRNPILVTALNPVIGYEKAAQIAKQAYQQQRPVLDVAEELTDLGRDKLSELLNPQKLTTGGVAE